MPEGAQVLLLTGFILLCEPFLGLVGYHVKRNEIAGAPRSMLATAAWLLEKLLLVAMILGAYVSLQLVQDDKATECTRPRPGRGQDGQFSLVGRHRLVQSLHC
jgi:hypothetical protein